MNKVVLYFVLFFAPNVYILKADCDVASETTASGLLYQPKEKLCPGDLIFEDSFDTFDLKKWQHEITLSGGGNGEFQFYGNDRSNSYVENGYLHIKPTYLVGDGGDDFLYHGTLQCYGGGPAEQCTDARFNGCSRTGTTDNILNPIKSARIRTAESFSFKYGSLVTRAKMPSGDWLWPAIWLMPRYNAYGGWPNSGEIDLLESRGNKNLVTSQGVNVGSQQISVTLHWGPVPHLQDYWVKNNDTGFDSDFHVYKMVWSSSAITFYIDDEEIGSGVPPETGFRGFNSSNLNNSWKGSSKMAPFDQEFYVIINLAIGGTFFSDDYVNPGGKPWTNHSPRAATDFWEGKSQWESTWNLGTDDRDLIVDYVQIFAI